MLHLKPGLAVACPSVTKEAAFPGQEPASRNPDGGGRRRGRGPRSASSCRSAAGRGLARVLAETGARVGEWGRGRRVRVGERKRQRSAAMRGAHHEEQMMAAPHPCALATRLPFLCSCSVLPSLSLSSPVAVRQATRPIANR